MLSVATFAHAGVVISNFGGIIPWAFSEQAKSDMDRAKQGAERARLAYNQAAKKFNDAKARYDRLAFVAMEDELKLATRTRTRES